MRERLRFRNNLGLGLRDVRQRSAFAALARGPWQVFIAIACHWQANAEAWPSQETIARFCGYTARAVRMFMGTLVLARIILLRRERQPNGAERIYYAPGPVALTELAAFVERFPREKQPTETAAEPSPREKPPAETVSATPPERVSPAPAEAVSMEHRDQDHEPSSLSEASPRDEEARVTQEDREVAREALAERIRRKDPSHPPPKWFDRADVELVARATAAVEGDRAAKLSAHREALAGAFAASRGRTPTVRFIWGTLAYFFEHASRGRRLRAARRLEPRMPRSAPERVPIGEMQADIERIFGRTG